jgi:mannose-6-phosphate isomerase-like protein (cupin superfamily)
MAETHGYAIHKDIKFGELARIDALAIRDAVTDPWFNQTLTRLNDCVVRIGVVQGEFHWHHHEREDEFFFVLDGRLFVDLEDRTIELGPNQGVTVPRRVRHRTRAPQRTTMLMFEGAGVEPTGDG